MTVLPFRNECGKKATLYTVQAGKAARVFGWSENVRCPQRCRRDWQLSSSACWQEDAVL